MPDRPADSRDRYFDRLAAPLWAVDADDRTIDVNPALVEALGYPAEEMMGRSPSDFLTEDSKETYRAQSILRRSGLADSFTVTFLTRSGAERSFRVSGSPVYEDGRFVGKIAVLRDLAVWSVLDDAMREANAELLAGLRADEHALRSLSHDLRNPLQAILGFADLLQREAVEGLADEQRSQLGMIATAAREAIARLEAFDRDIRPVLDRPGKGGEPPAVAPPPAERRS